MVYKNFVYKIRREIENIFRNHNYIRKRRWKRRPHEIKINEDTVRPQCRISVKRFITEKKYKVLLTSITGGFRNRTQRHGCKNDAYAACVGGYFRSFRLLRRSIKAMEILTSRSILEFTDV